jgi:curved DNA-binding protein CbpA
MPQTTRSPFDVLDIKATADIEVARAAYKALVRKYHPDLNRGQPGEALNARTVQLNWAIEELERDLPGWRLRSTAAPSGLNGRSQPAGEAPTGQQAQDPLSSPISFGKHRGRFFREIALVDPGYLRWMIREQIGSSTELRCAEAAFRVRAPRHQTASAGPSPSKRRRRRRISIREIFGGISLLAMLVF